MSAANAELCAMPVMRPLMADWLEVSEWVEAAKRDQLTRDETIHSCGLLWYVKLVKSIPHIASGAYCAQFSCAHPISSMCTKI